MRDPVVIFAGLGLVLLGLYAIAVILSWWFTGSIALNVFGP